MDHGQRIDKWLWIARVAKTRSLAARLVAAGSVRINGTRSVKPSRNLSIGDILTLVHNRHLRVLKVLGFGARRGPYAEARLLYEDLSPREERRSSLVRELSRPPAGRDKGAGRPTKRDRRRMAIWVGQTD